MISRGAPGQRSPIVKRLGHGLVALVLVCTFAAVVDQGPAVAAAAPAADPVPQAMDASSAPTWVTLASDRASFVAGTAAVLTATVDVALETSASVLTIRDRTTGVDLASCSNGTTCTATGTFATGTAHTYIARVNSLTSNTVRVSRRAWTLALKSSGSFVAGAQSTLTATANQDLAGTSGSYGIYIFDSTTGSVVGACGPTGTYTGTASKCVASVSWPAGASHDFTGMVAAWQTPAPSTPTQAADGQVTSGAVTVTRAPWNVALASDKNTFAAGQSFTLTATADQDVEATSGSYAVYIFDVTLGSLIRTCAPGESGYAHGNPGTSCSIVQSFATGAAHDYSAVVGRAVAPASRPQTSASVTEVQGVSGTVSIGRQAWSVSLTTSTASQSAGTPFILTATANQDVWATDNNYSIYIFDNTTGTRIRTCAPNESGYDHSATSTTCTVQQSIYTGGPHEFSVLVGRTTPPDSRPATPAAVSDVQATGNTVTVGRQAWQLTLSVDKPVFAAGETFTFTATANQDVWGTNGAYEIYVFDTTTGSLVGSCHPGYGGYDHGDFGTICTVKSTYDNFYSGGPRNYTAAVGAAKQYYEQPQRLDQVQDKQATSNSVGVSRQAWQVSITTDKTIIAAGERFTLTATINQDIASTNSTYELFIFDASRNSLVTWCNSGTTGYARSASGSVCTISTSGYLYSGDPRDYVAVIGTAGPNWFDKPNTLETVQDPQAQSNAVTIARKAWEVSIKTDRTVFSAGESFTLTATANQDVTLTDGQYGIYVVDATNGRVLGLCWTNGNYPLQHNGTSSTCTISTGYYIAGPNNYVAAVGRPSDFSNSQPISVAQIPDLQATSGSVTVARAIWSISLQHSTTFVSADETGATYKDTLLATANQDLSQTGGQYQKYYRIWIYNYTDGQLFNYPFNYPSCDMSTTFTCSASYQYKIGPGSPAQRPTQWVAYVAQGVNPLNDVQAVSNGVVTPSFGGTTGTEGTSGTNPSVNSCHGCQGDPVDTLTGELTESATDIGIPGKGPGLSITRTYASGQATTDGPLGFGWAINYNSRLAFTGGNSADPLPRLVTVTQNNGSTVTFVEGADRSYLPPSRVLASLTYNAQTLRWTFVRRATETMVFDSAGRMLSLADPSGNTVQIAYDPTSGRMSQITAAGGRALSLTWTGNRITAVNDSASRLVRYGYDSAGDLRSVTAVDGAVSQFEYVNHELTAKIAPRGGTVRTEYTSHRVTKQTDAVGRSTLFTYSGSAPTVITTTTLPDASKTIERYFNGQLQSRTKGADTAVASTFAYEYDDMNNIVKITDPTGATLKYKYDAAGNQIESTDPLGKVSKFSYDALNNKVAATDALQRQSLSTYDTQGNQKTATSPSGRTQRWNYNLDGTLDTSTDPAGKITHYGYDPVGNLTSVTDPNNNTTSYEYNAAGYLTKIIDPLNHRTSRVVDNIGRTLTVTDANNRTTTYEYDGDGNLKKTIDPTTLGVSAASYDLAGQLKSVTDANQGVTRYEYWPTGQVSSVSDANSHITTYAYDAVGNLSTVTDPLLRITRYLYDGDGRKLSTTLPSLAVVKTAFDDAGHVIKTTDANNHDTTYTYDSAGQLDTTTDPLGHITKHWYTADGQLDHLDNADGSRIGYTYNSRGALETYTNEVGHVWSYGYDDAGQLANTTEPGGRQLTYQYDDAGRQTVTTGDGGNTVTTTTTYDDSGQVTGTTTTSGASSVAVSYTYDEAGRRKTMTDATGQSSYSYDAAGQLLSSTNGANLTVRYHHDPAGQLDQLTYPGTAANTVTYNYDDAGQMISATDWANRATNFRWTADGDFAGADTPNGVTTVLGQDPAGQTSNISVRKATATLGSYDYTYDDAGRLATDTTSDPTTPAATKRTNSFTNTSLLSSVASTSGDSLGSGSFTPNAAGLLTAMPGKTQTFGPTERLATSTAAGVTTSYTYNTRGDRIGSSTPASGSTPANNRTYTYDLTDNLTRVVGTGMSTVSYTNDGDDLRQSRTQGNQAARPFTWAVDGSMPVLLDDGVYRYLYGPNLTPYAQINNATGVVQYLHSDQLGTPRLVTDATGAVTAAFRYDAYGNRVAVSGTATTNIGFTGAWTDAINGLVYLRARVYDPVTGQFLTVDPVVLTTHQPYSYADANPLQKVDPTGLSWLGDIVDKAVLSGPADWLTKQLTTGIGGNVVAFLEGVGDGATFGLTASVRDAISPGASCFVNKNGFYYAGEITGTALGLVVDPIGSLAGKAVGVAAAVVAKGAARALPRAAAVVNALAKVTASARAGVRIERAAPSVERVASGAPNGSRLVSRIKARTPSGDAGAMRFGRAPEYEGGQLSEARAMDVAQQWLGVGYREVKPGRYISEDGERVVRYGAHETNSSRHHMHFEAYRDGFIVENTVAVIIP